MMIIEHEGKSIQLTDEECYRVFIAVLTGISSSALQTYIQRQYGAVEHFDKGIFDRLGRDVAINFLDNLRDGLYIPGAEDDNQPNQYEEEPEEEEDEPQINS